MLRIPKGVTLDKEKRRCGKCGDVTPHLQVLFGTSPEEYGHRCWYCGDIKKMKVSKDCYEKETRH